ncbi:hypothetical protein [Methylobacterium sp. Leaf466]|uniref:phage adaptor protein n=1 Tax=Methylobacterium sp. Leaf466 TaxID=1736386 RepID=UPI0006F851CA|nr:hypothetical protein [Methylobacterium sp. Leaf466]KQT82433.1 hypothetical protein ASG59_18750 [Methylobacterium sp. Leaf466]
MPVTLADIRVRVLDDLKRNDVLRSLASTADYTRLDRWIRDSVRRIQRTLRTPIDEAISEATIPEGFTGAVNVPGNLLEPISIQVDGRVLEMRGITEVKALQRHQTAGRAMYCAREAGQYLIAPLPSPGSVVTIVYRADFNNVGAPTDSLKLFEVADDLVTLGALISAASWSIDDKRLNTWNTMFNTLFIELQDMSDRAELLNASIRPSYNFDADWSPNG